MSRWTCCPGDMRESGDGPAYRGAPETEDLNRAYRKGAPLTRATRWRLAQIDLFCNCPLRSVDAAHHNRDPPMSKSGRPWYTVLYIQV